MAHRTAEEALVDDISVLGPMYGLAFYHCCQELWRLSSTWDRYEALFGSQQRVDILNESSGGFWNAIQGLLLDHVLLSISRLTDPADQGKRRNLSIWTLAALDPSEHKQRLKQRVHKATNKSSFARTWRDKRIAHNDFEQSTALANKLAPATGRKIVAAIVAIHEVLRWVSAKHFDSNMGLMEMGDFDATDVMACIDDGLKYRALREADYDAGIPVSRYENRYDWIQTGADPKQRYRPDPKLILPRSKSRRR